MSRSLSGFFLAVIFIVLAQASPLGSVSITGVVTSDDVPLSGVNIYIEQLQLGAMSDENGFYRISHLPAGEFTLVASFIGYQSFRRQIFLRDEPIQLDLNLRRTFLHQNDIAVTTSVIPQNVLGSNRSMSILDSEELSSEHGQSMGDMLDKYPGISSLSQGPAISKPVIRGMTNDRIVILEDGVRHEAQQWGDHHTPELDLGDAGRVEVLRGPGSLIYGSGAVGGVVRIVPAELKTRSEGSQGYYGQLIVTGGSNAHEFGASTHLGSSRLHTAWELHLSGKRAGNYSAPENNTFLLEQNFTAFSNQEFGLRLKQVTSHGSLNFSYSDYFERQGLIGQGHWHNSGGGADGTEPWFHEGGGITSPTRHKKASMKWNSISGPSRLQIVTSWQSNHRRGIPDELPTAVDLSSEFYSVRILWHHLLAEISPITLGISADVKQDISRGSEVLIPDSRANSVALFWTQRYQLHRNLSVSGGLRLDWRRLDVEYTDMGNGNIVESRELNFRGILSSSFGLVWHVPDNPYSLAVNLGTGFRYPGTIELFIDGIHHAANRYERGRSDLKEETSIGIESIVRYQKETFYAVLTGFHNRLQNYIFTNPTGTTVITSAGAQIPLYLIDQTDAEINGLEVTLRKSFRQHFRIEFSFEAVRGRINRPLTDADNDGKIEQNLPSMPADHMELTFTRCLGSGAKWQDLHIFVSISYTAAQKRTAEFENIIDTIQSIEFASDSYTIMNGGFSLQAHPWNRHIEITAKVQNLLNKQYTSHLSSYKGIASNPGMDVRLSLKFLL